MLVTFLDLVTVKLQKLLTFMIKWKRDSPIRPERLVHQNLKEKFNSVFPKLKSRWLFRVFLQLIRNKKIIKVDWCKKKSYVKVMLQYLLISAYLRRSRALLLFFHYSLAPLHHRGVVIFRAFVTCASHRALLGPPPEALESRTAFAKIILWRFNVRFFDLREIVKQKITKKNLEKDISEKIFIDF